MNRAPVTVVVPAFGRLPLVREAVSSVIGQTLLPMRLVVVDDGSNPQLALDGLPDWATLLRQENAGVAAARNRGVALSETEWIAFLDSDDLWNHDFLARIFALAPEADVLYGDLEDFTSDGPGRTGYVRRLNGNVTRELLRLEPVASPSSIVIRRSLFGRLGGFDEDRELSPSADWELWCRLSLESNFSYRRGALARRRIHPETMTAAPAQMARAAALAVSRIFDNPRFAEFSESRHVTEAHVDVMSAGTYFSAGNRRASGRALAAAIRKYPCALFWRVWWGGILRVLTPKPIYRLAAMTRRLRRGKRA